MWDWRQETDWTTVYILTVISLNSWWTRSKNHRERTIWTKNDRVFWSSDSRAIPTSLYSDSHTLELRMNRNWANTAEDTPNALHMVWSRHQAAKNGEPAKRWASGRYWRKPNKVVRATPSWSTPGSGLGPGDAHGTEQRATRTQRRTGMKCSKTDCPERRK
jgi:hypothetical protein